MKSLPADLIIEKNKIASDSAWLVLLDIELNNPDSTHMYFVRNTEDVTFDGQEYSAFPFEIDQTVQESRGQIPSITLRVSNATRLFAEHLKRYDGGIGSLVTIIVVNSENLSANYAELTMTFDVIGTNVARDWCTFTLGAPNPLVRKFPKYRYIANHCNWKFGSVECGYVVNDVWSGAGVSYTPDDLVYLEISAYDFTNYKCSTAHTSSSATRPGTLGGMAYWGASPCARTLNDCRGYDNSPRFGGYVGLGSGGIRIV